jgi:hypothetical protein
MRNAADWGAQPGVVPLDRHVEVVALS